MNVRPRAPGLVSFAERLLGALLFLGRRRRAEGELAAAFPALDANARVAIARRSAELQARLGRERFPTRDAVRLCRDLALDGSEALQRLRAHPPAATAAFTAACGAPALAERALRLYGGDPLRVVHLLPPSGSSGATARVPDTNRGATFEFLGRTIHCATDWLPPEATLLFPVFGLLAPRRRLRVLFEPPFEARGAEPATRAALAAIERVVRAHPEAWPWGARPQDSLRRLPLRSDARSRRSNG